MGYLLGVLGVILLLALAAAAARRRFARMARGEARELLLHSGDEGGQTITGEDLRSLPRPVRRWLERSGVVGKERIRTVRLRQTGTMRTSPQGAWMPFAAEQYFNVGHPGFVWLAFVRAAPFIHLAGRDLCLEGRSHMLIKAMSLYPVVDARGDEIDQGSLVRYLSETAWFPTAALSPYISWAAVDDQSARAVMSWGGITTEGVFHFDPAGDLVRFTAWRHRQQGSRYTLELWETRTRGHRERHGLRIPTRGEVIWRLPEGDFSWAQVEITEIEYNPPGIY
ncbi:MAG: hypothetical protein HPY50_18040 [Firmicutes bacterium]|nr:hypothetical protein [Bacillota bacterium]